MQNESRNIPNELDSEKMHLEYWLANNVDIYANVNTPAVNNDEAFPFEEDVFSPAKQVENKHGLFNCIPAYESCPECGCTECVYYDAIGGSIDYKIWQCGRKEMCYRKIDLKHFWLVKSCQKEGSNEVNL